MQPPLAKNQQVNLMPLTLPVPELEIRPGPERITLRKKCPGEAEPFGFVGELRARHLGPALRPSRHDAASSTRSPARPYGCQSKIPILPVQMDCVRRHTLAGWYRSARPG